MAIDFTNQFEQARRVYRERLDVYRSSHKEEDLAKVNEAFKSWLNTNRIFMEPKELINVHKRGQIGLVR